MQFGVKTAFLWFVLPFIFFGHSVAQLRLIEQYSVRFEAKDPSGNAVPATLIIRVSDDGKTQTGSLRSGSYTVALRAGYQYEIEAIHEQFQTARKTLRLGGQVTDASQAQQTVVLTMVPRQAEVSSVVTVRVVDYATGRPLAERFTVQLDNLTTGKSTELKASNDGSISFKADLLSKFRLNINAKSYRPYQYQIEDVRTQNFVTIRLRRKTQPTPSILRVIDGKTQKLVTEAEILVASPFEQNLEVKKTRKPGEWQLQLDDSTDYAVIIYAPGYRPYRGTLRRRGGKLDDVVVQSVRPTADTTRVATRIPEKPSATPTSPAPAPPASTALPTLATGKTVTLDNVYFDQSSYQLRPESYAQLNQLLAALKAKPTLRIEVAGHTDNVGDARLNLGLSENRARVITNYLIIRGIAESRLHYKGYGSTQPVAASDTEENRKKNRRVEVRVIGE